MTAVQRIALIAAICLGSVSAVAQTAPPRGGVKSLPEAPAKLPKPERTRDLEFLFGALKAAPDQAAAKQVETRIWALWTQTPSDTTSLLMSRARLAMEAKQMDVARRLLDSVVRLKPDYIEGWNRRATLTYLTDDYTQSLADIDEVLKREPRHFGALTGLGMIMKELGDERRALDAFRRALAVNPFLDNIPELVRTLTQSVEGRDI